MEQEIIDSVLQLLKEGGHAAFVLVLVYWVLGFFKPIVLMGMLVWCAIRISTGALANFTFSGQVAGVVGSYLPLTASERVGIIRRLQDSVEQKPWGIGGSH